MTTVNESKVKEKFRNQSFAILEGGQQFTCPDKACDVFFVQIFVFVSLCGRKVLLNNNIKKKLLERANLGHGSL